MKWIMSKFFNYFLYFLGVVVLVLFMVALFACSKAAPVEGVNIMFFVSEPKTVSTYGTATLSWAVQRGLLVILSGGGASAVVAAEGTFDVIPGEETTYTLHAVGPEDTVDERRLTVQVDRTSPCGSLAIPGHTGTSAGVEVEVGPNPHPYYSAKDVVVQVQLYGESGNMIETGTAMIPEIAPGKTGKVFVRLGKAGKQARTECSIVGCDCDYTEPK